MAINHSQSCRATSQHLLAATLYICNPQHHYINQAAPVFDDHLHPVRYTKKDTFIPC